MAGRVHEQREEGHVEHDGLGVEQGDDEGLLEILARADVEDGCAAGLGGEHPESQPGQVGGAQPLHGAEGRRVGRQQGRHTGHGQPHQHLITGDHAQGGSQPA
ncbi:hypothetical protein D9M68_975300 [compost metagenome]